MYLIYIHFICISIIYVWHAVQAFFIKPPFIPSPFIKPPFISQNQLITNLLQHWNFFLVFTKKAGEYMCAYLICMHYRSMPILYVQHSIPSPLLNLLFIPQPLFITNFLKYWIFFLVFIEKGEGVLCTCLICIHFICVSIIQCIMCILSSFIKPLVYSKPYYQTLIWTQTN